MSENKEYIERGALMERLSGFVVTSDIFGMGVQAGYTGAITEVRKAQAVDVEPVVLASRVEKSYDIDGECVIGFVCSSCGASQFDGLGLAKRCYNCGAHMVKK